MHNLHTHTIRTDTSDPSILKCFLMSVQVLEAQMKADLADKESLEQKRAQHEEEAREKCKLISEQKAVSVSSSSHVYLRV